MIAAVLLLTGMSVTMSSPAAAHDYCRPNFGVFQIGVGSNPPVAMPVIGDAAACADGFVLKGALTGTFLADFRLPSAGVAVVKNQAFSVKNTGSWPVVLTVIAEDRLFKPVSPTIDEGELAKLKACFNQLCDAPIASWISSGQVPPPYPLAVLQPGQTQTFRVGFYLDPTADLSKWNNRRLVTTLYFAAPPA